MKKAAACATLIAFASGSALADASLSFSASVESIQSQQFVYLNSADLPQTFNTGLMTLAAGNGAASLQAWADPTRGVFKSKVTASVGAGLPTTITNAYANLDLSDTLRFTGPGSTVQVSVSLSHDAVLSGLDKQQFSAYQLVDHVIQAGSNRNLSLNYTINNPNYDPNATCTNLGSDGMICPPETQQTLSFTEYASSDVSGQVEYQRNWWNNDRHIVRFGLGDGHYTGTDTYTFTLPTNVDIHLNYRAWSTAECFHMANCNMMADASHSDYLGLSVTGGSFSSASQYQYLGLAAAVPEPSSAMLALGGLVGLLAWRRRQDKSA